MERVIVVGAGYAGMTCALRLAHRAEGLAEVMLVDARERFVERIRLHETIAGRAPRVRTLASMVEGTGVVLRQGWVREVDLAARTITIGDETIAWDRLVLAMGSSTDTASTPGVREHALTLDADGAATAALAIDEAATRGGRVVVVGGGLTGIEAAAEIAERHPAARVSLVSRGALLPGWSRAARAHVERSLARLGVDVHADAGVRAVRSAELDTARGAIAFDVCLWTAGFAAPTLPRESGLAVDADGRARVDALLRSVSHPAVRVIGDLARPPGDVPMGCKSAEPMGAHAAECIARELAGESSRAFDLAVPGFCVSLGRGDGLVQLTDARGELDGAVITGRLAAWIKEGVCRATVWTLALERRGLASTTWARRPALAALPSGEPLARHDVAR